MTSKDVMFGKHNLEMYKAEAIAYEMCFGKAHEDDVEWLRGFLVKYPLYLPEGIFPKEERDATARKQFKLIDDYLAWASSSARSDGMSSKLKELIIKTFFLD